jgi:hypothetical protein
VAQIYGNVVRHSLKCLDEYILRPLEVLSFVQLLEEDADEDFPSWIPRWDRSKMPRWIFGSAPFAEAFQASMDLDAAFLPTVNEMALILGGIEIATIQEVDFRLADLLLIELLPPGILYDEFEVWRAIKHI